MENANYSAIPEVPSEISATKVLVRLIDGLGFRYSWATHGIKEEMADYRPVEGSMSVREVSIHIHDLIKRTYLTFGGEDMEFDYDDSFVGLRESTLDLVDKARNLLVAMDDNQLKNCNYYRKKTDSSYPFWYLVNGPIADILTHIGQILTWRRMAGFPQQKGVDVFLGEKF